ncbi:MAG TPA: YbaB/EbfC family nucleoid-associated protein [Caldisericia bacterium]|nr:YbaB/EbfC family nucleoid-associated protein [Caldisericia bacterium]HPF49120.1 YbaB/EbfC family nucleoid-associated protein [Caldisericia bacterium]HPI83016.1 YbaB/EbfC family nucleoid-associated protein [Caldisericia bacterium]HPQ92243.1 YbaB/EbfC family nucleoid-associated protein [Caldisericia bacterium]HRV74659.1 YbaB/EbfC family nucleoid-associated protein [Caldisericia bacterium]
MAGQMDMMKQAMAMRKQMMVVDRELSAMRIEEELGKGTETVTVIVNGKMEIQGLAISDDAMKLPKDKLSKLILQTVTKAQSSAKNEATKKARSMQM